jgi:tRNA-splicing ligase RtcB
MGARSYIVRGKGNEKSFNSCRMVQAGACRVVLHVVSSVGKTWSTRPEALNAVRIKALSTKFPVPSKDIDQVMENQIDLVEPVHTLKQVLCVKR